MPVFPHRETGEAVDIPDEVHDTDSNSKTRPGRASRRRPS